MKTIIKRQPEPHIDARILAYWLMFCRAPKRAELDADGMYDLSEIGSVRLEHQRLHRDTPYSVCKGIREE
jgi:hypothetical protein